MGLMIAPGDDDVTSPDVSWSYTGFHMFRDWLARTEGFTLNYCLDKDVELIFC
ncbi:hypothetical protein GCM10010129_58050 [Streptomyces fumigatiscleroticus]|nr:hypothetical protein GCM10010129_58050 [Streptomyces fumigatiscleroticus]